MNNIEKAVRDVANFMASAARTAPKAKGTDNLIIKIFEKEELDELARKMAETGRLTSRPGTFERDAESVKKSHCVVLIATKSQTLGLDCGFCGAETCGEARQKNITCAYNSGDLGIAVGSAAATASDFHIDNRIMYTIGYTVKKNGMLGEDVRMALGIPLAAAGKSPFFDR